MSTTTLESLSSTAPLHHGADIPVLGLGTWKAQDGNEAVAAVRDALEVGYRHIDTAAAYGNEESVGRAIREFGNRDEVFITTKLATTDMGYDSALKNFDASRQRLGVDIIDLYLIHWPCGVQFMDTWRAFEKLLADGKVRSIGVSNFLRPHLQTLLDEADIKPALNQVETHPWLLQPELHEFHRQQGIVSEAWSPLMQGKFGEIRELAEIAEAHGKHPTQILIRWNLQLGIVSIPKSTNRAHIEANADVFDFTLTDEQMSTLNGLDQHKRLGPDPNTFNA